MSSTAAYESARAEGSLLLDRMVNRMLNMARLSDENDGGSLRCSRQKNTSLSDG
jgi:hypothetical protein